MIGGVEFQFSISISYSNMEKQCVNYKKTSKWTHSWQKCEKFLGQVKKSQKFTKLTRMMQ